MKLAKIVEDRIPYSKLTDAEKAQLVNPKKWHPSNVKDKERSTYYRREDGTFGMNVGFVDAVRI